MFDSGSNLAFCCLAQDSIVVILLTYVRICVFFEFFGALVLRALSWAVAVAPWCDWLNGLLRRDFFQEFNFGTFLSPNVSPPTSARTRGGPEILHEILLMMFLEVKQKLALEGGTIWIMEVARIGSWIRRSCRIYSRHLIFWVWRKTRRLVLCSSLCSILARILRFVILSNEKIAKITSNRQYVRISVF